MQKEEEDEEDEDDVDEEEEEEEEEEMVEEEDFVSIYMWKKVEILCSVGQKLSECRFRNQAFVISFDNWQFWKNEDDEMEGDYTESQLEEIQAQTEDDDDDVIQLDGELLFVKTD